MSDEKKKKPTLNLLSMKAQVDAQSDAFNERLDGMEEELSKQNANVEEMLEMMRGMSAQNRPTGGPAGAEIEAAALVPEGGVAAEMLNPDSSKITMVEPTSRSLEEPAMADKMAKLKFDQERLTIHIQETNEEQADTFFEVGLNGKNWLFQVGQTYDNIPRCVVGVLASAKPFTYTNEEYTDNGIQKVRQLQKMGLRYPFTVIHDPNPMGPEWLKAALSQRH